MGIDLLRTRAKKSIFDFVQSEDGAVGKSNALAIGTILGASALGLMLLSAVPDADAFINSWHTNHCNHTDASF